MMLPLVFGPEYLHLPDQTSFSYPGGSYSEAKFYFFGTAVTGDVVASIINTSTKKNSTVGGAIGFGGETVPQPIFGVLPPFPPFPSGFGIQSSIQVSLLNCIQFRLTKLSGDAMNVSGVPALSTWLNMSSYLGIPLIGYRVSAADGPAMSLTGTFKVEFRLGNAGIPVAGQFTLAVSRVG